MRRRINSSIGLAFIALVFSACGIPDLVNKTANTTVTESYNNSLDTVNTATIKWKDYFTDPYLNALIDSALKNNQELNIMLQEISMTNNEIRARKGEYLPFLHLGGGAGVEKTSRHTRNGAVEANKNNEITSGEGIPEQLQDYSIAANVTWEVDIWNKLHNAKKSAVYKYLASIEGRNFMVTNLVAEVASSYYELMALDNQLDILNQNIEIQKNALKIVKLQKTAAKVTELAVRKFEAEVLKNQSRQYYIQQSIIETENRLNFLLGRYPQPIPRNSQTFNNLLPDTIYAGIPSQLLANRPDIRQAEMELEAAKLDVKVAKADFYPSFDIMAGIGYKAFNASYLLTTPESMMYNLAGELVAPVINRNAIKASYLNANAKKIQVIYNYERTILNGYIEVVNQLSMIANLKKSYDLKVKQVQALNESITISTNLFKSAKADYMEVLMTQRDALEARMELVETKQHQMVSFVNMYRALGGGWN